MAGNEIQDQGQGTATASSRFPQKCEVMLADQADHEGNAICWMPPTTIPFEVRNWARQELSALSGPRVTVDQRRLIGWLVRLGELTAGQISADEVRGRVTAYAEMLSARPSGQFSDASLEFVARRCRWWPAYADLIAALDDWVAALTSRRERLKRLAEEASRPAPPASERRDPEATRRGKLFFEWFAMEVLGHDRPDLVGLTSDALIAEATLRDQARRGTNA